METTTKNGGPAFPRVRLGVGATQSVSEDGMSLRDWFAGQYVSGVTGRQDPPYDDFESLAEMSYKVADSMLAEREK